MLIPNSAILLTRIQFYFDVNFLDVFFFFSIWKIRFIIFVDNQIFLLRGTSEVDCFGVECQFSQHFLLLQSEILNLVLQLPQFFFKDLLFLFQQQQLPTQLINFTSISTFNFFIITHSFERLKLLHDLLWRILALFGNLPLLHLLLQVEHIIVSDVAGNFFEGFKLF